MAQVSPRALTVGFLDRDYYREKPTGSPIAAWGVEFPVVKYLIFLNVAVFLLQIFITQPIRPHFAYGDPDAQELAEPDDEAGQKMRDRIDEMLAHVPSAQHSTVQEWLELDPVKTIKKGQVWRLVTSAFCHDRHNIWHIVFNMLMLYWFGRRLEQMYGSREFLLFYLAAAICGSLAYVGLAFYTHNLIPAIGASGAVMGVMMVYTIYYPNEEFLLFFLIPVPLWVLLGGYVIYDLHPILLTLSGERVFTQVAHAGHLGGLAFGFLYWRFGLRLDVAFDRQPRRRVRRKTGPFREPVILSHPKRSELADRVDEVLKKISEHGKESLTDDERALLDEASARYRGAKS
ncbi:MAG: rhomboid family intramembrane serine protease [Gemmataceae bacterium]